MDVSMFSWCMWVTVDKFNDIICNRWMQGCFHDGYNLQWMNAMTQLSIDLCKDIFHDECKLRWMIVMP